MIEELIEMAKAFQDAMARDDALGLNPDEIAFYDALAENEVQSVNWAMTRSSWLLKSHGNW